MIKNSVTRDPIRTTPVDPKRGDTYTFQDGSAIIIITKDAVGASSYEYTTVDKDGHVSHYQGPSQYFPTWRKINIEIREIE